MLTIKVFLAFKRPEAKTSPHSFQNSQFFGRECFGALCSSGLNLSLGKISEPLSEQCGWGHLTASLIITCMGCEKFPLIFTLRHLWGLQFYCSLLAHLFSELSGLFLWCLFSLSRKASDVASQWTQDWTYPTSSVLIASALLSLTPMLCHRHPPNELGEGSWRSIAVLPLSLYSGRVLHWGKLKKEPSSLFLSLA